MRSLLLRLALRVEVFSLSYKYYLVYASLRNFAPKALVDDLVEAAGAAQAAIDAVGLLGFEQPEWSTVRGLFPITVIAANVSDQRGNVTYNGTVDVTIHQAPSMGELMLMRQYINQQKIANFRYSWLYLTDRGNRQTCINFVPGLGAAIKQGDWAALRQPCGLQPHRQEMGRWLAFS